MGRILALMRHVGGAGPGVMRPVNGRRNCMSKLYRPRPDSDRAIMASQAGRVKLSALKTALISPTQEVMVNDG